MFLDSLPAQEEYEFNDGSLDRHEFRFAQILGWIREPLKKLTEPLLLATSSVDFLGQLCGLKPSVFSDRTLQPFDSAGVSFPNSCMQKSKLFVQILSFHSQTGAIV